MNRRCEAVNFWPAMPPLTETERADALTARSLHDREYTWRQIGHAMRRDPEQVRRLVQRLNHEEGENA